MAAASHSPEFAKKLGIPVKVAREFNRADAGTRIRKTSRKKA
jgi:aspartokinase